MSTSEFLQIETDPCERCYESVCICGLPPGFEEGSAFLGEFLQVETDPCERCYEDVCICGLPPGMFERPNLAG